MSIRSLLRFRLDSRVLPPYSFGLFVKDTCWSFCMKFTDRFGYVVLSELDCDKMTKVYDWTLIWQRKEGETDGGLSRSTF
jgi:hypothetical protein